MAQRYFCSRCRASCETRLAVCPSCGQWDNYVPDVLMAPRTGPGEATIVSARYLASRRPQTQEVWSLGKISLRPPLLVAAYGPPGAGKSTWLLKISSELIRAGQRVLYVSAEEGLGETVSDRLRRLEVRDDNLFLVGNVGYQLAKEAALSKECTCLVLDSWSAASWSAPDLDDARAVFLSFISLHVTKEGDAAGPNSILHVSDLVVHIDVGGKAKLEKSRWSGQVETEVFA